MDLALIYNFSDSRSDESCIWGDGRGVYGITRGDGFFQRQDMVWEVLPEGQLLRPGIGQGRQKKPANSGFA
jgi:hypothetical protein